MGRPRKNLVEAEVSESSEAKPATKLVDAKHVITYVEPVKVPASPEESGVDDPEEFEFEEDGKPERTQKPSFRTKLRDKLSRNGIADSEQLRLRIDRLPLYDANGQSGVNAEKEFVRTTTCTEAFITGDEYLDHIRTVAGPGTYWLTLRHKNTIVASWQERIAGNPQTAPSSDALPFDAGTVVNPQNPSDLMDAMFKQFEKFQKFQAAIMPPWMKGFDASQMMQANGQSQPLTDETALLHILNREGDVVDKVAGKLKTLLRGDSHSEEKGWVDVIHAALTSPTLPQTIQVLISQFRQPTADQPMQPATAPPQQPAISPDVAAYERLIQRLLQAVHVNADVEPEMTTIEGFLALFPEHEFTLTQMLNTPTEMLLPALAQTSPMAAEIAQMPHAKEWIEKLKTAYFNDASEGQPE